MEGLILEDGREITLSQKQDVSPSELEFLKNCMK